MVFLYSLVCFIFLDSHISESSICLFLSDILLNIIPSTCIHVVVNDRISFFFMAECYSVMYTPHLHPSFVDGHLDYLRVLAIVNDASTNNGVHMSFLFSVFFPLEIYSAVKLLDYAAVLYLRIGASLFPAASVPIYIPTNSVLEFHFLYILSNICFFLTFSQ